MRRWWLDWSIPVASVGSWVFLAQQIGWLIAGAIIAAGPVIGAIWALIEGTVPPMLDSIAVRLSRVRFTFTTTSLAAVLAGRRRNLRDTWLADLAGDPEKGVVLGRRQQRRLAAGFLLAAVRMRLHDACRPLWVPVDWLLISRERTNTAITAVVGTLVVYVQIVGGLLTVIADLPGFGVLAPALYGLAAWLRTIRGIKPAKRAGNR